VLDSCILTETIASLSPQSKTEKKTNNQRFNSFNLADRVLKIGPLDFKTCEKLKVLPQAKRQAWNIKGANFNFH
jgi:hypothetical protein